MTVTAYTNAKHQTILTPAGANYGQRSVPGDVLLAVVHFTEGKDSRQYLLHNPSGVSTTYLIGEYPNADQTDPATFPAMQGVAIYKYCSETTGKAYTQGYGVLGMLGTYNHNDMAQTGIPRFATYRNPNDVGISFEIEAAPGSPPSEAVLEETSTLIASVIEYWAAKGKQLLLIGHMHLDSEKSDPQLDWSPFAKRVYDKAVF